jgi:hypothetical protein
MRESEQTGMLKSYWRIGLTGLVIIILGTMVVLHTLSKQKTPTRFGYHALKINGRFVDPGIFSKEKNRFFMQWRRNADMLRKTDEERMDLMLEEIIDQTLIEDYLYRHSGIKVAPQEVDEYINRYIKTKYASPSDFNAFMQNAGYTSDAELHKGIELYLLKLKCFSRLSKERGITIPSTELDSLYQKHKDENYESIHVDSMRSFYHPKPEFADMALVKKFGASEEFKTWIADIKSRSSVEILDPAMKAYRLYRNGRYNQAGALYEKLFRRRQKERYLQRAIETYQMAKNWAKMIQLSRIGIKKFPEKMAYALNKAEGLYRKGRLNEALKLLKNAEPRAQGSSYSKELLVQTYKKLGLEKDAQRVKDAMSK